MSDDRTRGTPFGAVLRRATDGCLAIGAVLCCLAGMALAQEAGASLTGKVTDPQGQAIPGARVTLLNETSRDVLGTTSNQEGEYAFPFVPAGRYTLTAAIGGFTTATQTAIEVKPGDRPRRDFTLEIAVVSEEIVVTGTRIRNAAVTASSPLQVVDAELIEDQAAINVQEALETSPSFGVPGASRYTSNTDINTVGTATVNLRNLGANRTLVLLDGRRMVAGQPGTTQVDLSMIPTDFLDRVEVLTGGASAVYGSDAISGVVNLIYKKGFQGLIMRAQTGVSGEGDDEQYLLSLTAGQNFAEDRGNFMVHADWSDQGLVSSQNRSRTNDSWASVGHLNRNPGQVFERTLQRSGVISAGIVQTRDASGRNRDWTFDRNGNPVIWGATQDERFNGTEYRAIASPVDRVTTALRATYDFADYFTGFLESGFGRVNSQTYFEPSPFVGTSNIIGIGVPLNLENWLLNPRTGETRLVRNPFIPDPIYNSATDTNADGLRDASFSRRLTDFGPRIAPIERETWRFAVGGEGRIGSGGWLYDLGYSYGRTRRAGTMEGLYHGPNLRAALTVGQDVFDLDGDGDRTDPVCVDPDARARGCVPANMFGDGTMTQPMLDYVRGRVVQSSDQSLHAVSANATGPVFGLPAGPIRLAGGVEYRQEASEHIFDPLSNTNQNGFVQLTNTVGDLDVTEGYGEVNIPLISNKSLAKSLSIRAAGRLSNYSTVGSVVAYDGGVEWSPINDLRVRYVYAHAVRAPNVGELFAAPNAGISTIVDPCEGVRASDTSPLAVNCKAAPGVMTNINAHGGVFTLNQSDVQGVGTLTANNPNIAEETGTTHIFGLGLTPRFASGLAIAVDYYNIELDDAISRVSAATVLNKCYREGLSEFCDFVTRRPQDATPWSAGSVEQLVRGLVNSGGAWSEGVDVTASYGHDLWGGRASLWLSYTHLFDQGIIPLTGDPEDLSVGEIGLPKNKWFSSLRFDKGKLGAAVSGEFIGRSYLDDTYWTARFGRDAGKENFGVDSAFYLDLQVRYRLGGNQELYVGSKNVFNREPPPLYEGVPGGSADYGTHPGAYDAVGRRFYAGVRARF